MTAKAFTYTGAVQTFVVPAGVTSVVCEAWGADGGPGVHPSGTPRGGRGEYVKGTLAVTAGETLRLYVGGKGMDAATLTAQANDGRHFAFLPGGFNGGGGNTMAFWTGGGYNGATGGGATDLRQGGAGIANRQIVAGGGGGGGNWPVTNANGYPVPQSDVSALNGGDGGDENGASRQHVWSWGGLGGRQSAYTQADINAVWAGTAAQHTENGGAGTSGIYIGFADGGFTAATANTATSGGVGAEGAPLSDQGAGAGGGGLIGGLSGGIGLISNFILGGSFVTGGPGGGGSGFVGGSNVTGGVTDPGASTTANPDRTGNGYARLTWSAPPLAATITSPPNNGLVVQAAAIDVEVTPNDPDGPVLSVDIQYRPAAGGSWVSGTSTTTTVTIPAGTLSIDTSYEVQGRSTNPSGTGAYGPSSFFTPSAAPGPVTITSPTAGETVSVASEPVSWTLPAGYSQIGYQLRRTSDTAGTVVYWLGAQVNSSAQTGFAQMDAVSGRTDHLQVSFNANGFWSDWADVAVDVELGPPPVPLLSGEQLLVNGVPGPKVRLRVTNPAATSGLSPATSNNVHWLQSDGTWLRIATGVAVNGFVEWSGAPVGDLVFRAEAVAANGATSLSIIGGPS